MSATVRPTSIPMQAMLLAPQYHHRVWGGDRLQPGTGQIGEAWIVYEGDKIASGALEGQTLAEVASKMGEALLGRRGMRTGRGRFPLLIKLLDTREWLSLQVHPNDEQAMRLEGEGHFGKTEAWHILHAEPGAQLISGLKKGTTQEALAGAIKGGSILDHAHYIDVHAGDTVYTPAGTVHALGPGLLLYEVQQTSDLTYRVFDWNRSQEGGRALHIDKSLAVCDPAKVGEAIPRPKLDERGVAQLICCPYFALDLLGTPEGGHEVVGHTAGESFHAITVIEGSAEAEGDGWRHSLGLYGTLVVPASAGEYTLRGNFHALRSSVAPE